MAKTEARPVPKAKLSTVFKKTEQEEDPRQMLGHPYWKGRAPWKKAEEEIQVCSMTWEELRKVSMSPVEAGHPSPKFRPPFIRISGEFKEDTEKFAEPEREVREQIMAGHRHHSGYLADDEAGHSTYMARVSLPKKSLLPEVGLASRLGHVSHPPSIDGKSAYQSHRQSLKYPRAFGSFLDFLTEGQVLDSLQSVVEQATERVATMKTEAGVPLVDVQDPMEEISGRRRARPTVHRHRSRPTLCAGRPNNYPSCSSSLSDSHSSVMAGCLDSHTRKGDLGARGIGSLPPMKDKLLLEKNLKRLLRLENKGKGLNQSCLQRDSLLRDSLGSPTNSQWTPEQPLSWFSGLLGSSATTPEASDLGPGEQELMFLKQELNKKLQSLLSQPMSFNIPGYYCSLREPYCTLDFLAEHHLFPALQSVISQAVDKFSRARRLNGVPLFPDTSEPTPGLHRTADPLRQDSKLTLTNKREDGKEPGDSPTTSSPKISRRKSKGRRVSPTITNPLMAAKLRLKVTPTEEPNVPSPLLFSRQESPDVEAKLQKSPGVQSSSQPNKPQSSSQPNKPRHGLHITLPAPGVTLEMTSSPHSVRGPVLPQLASYHHPSSYFLPMSPFSSLSPNKFTKKKPLPSISPTVSYNSDPWCGELTNFLIEQAVSLLICKYQFEDSLNKQLGFISFPVTEALMDIFLGFKKVKGTHIRLSSNINWSCLLHKLEEAELLGHVSRPSASHPAAAQQGTQAPPVQPEAADANQDQASESCPSAHSEMPILQLFSPQDSATDQEQTPGSLSESKLSGSMLSNIGVDSSSPMSKEMPTIEDGEGSEEDEDNGSAEDEGEESSEYVRISPSMPESGMESMITGPSDPP